MRSPQHRTLATAALVWLRNRATGSGIRASTEVYVAEGYIADALALAGFQDRFAEPYARAAGYTTTYLSSQPQPENLIISRWAHLFEVKVSRGDFLQTFGPAHKKHDNRHEPIASLHWCVTPKGLVRPSELPDFWGLLEWTGRGLRERHPPMLFSITEGAYDRLGCQILWAMDTFRGDVGRLAV